MPGKVARTGGGSKTQPPKKTTSSSSSSKTSKTSSSSSVKKSTPPPAKPKNVDKVEFNKPKPKTDAGTYKKPPQALVFIDKTTVAEREKGKISMQVMPETEFKRIQRETHKEKIDERAHKQLEAEKKARTEEAPKKIHKVIVKAPLVLTATAFGGGWAGLATNTILDLADINEAKAHDQGKMSSTERIIYEENLYEHSHFAAPCGSGLTAQGIMDKEYDKTHQTEIDQRKAEIRAEEEENEKK